VVDLYNGVGSLPASSTPYTATITLSSNGVAFATVPVSLLVTASNVPVLLGKPALSTFSSSSGSVPAAQTIAVVGSDNPGSTTSPTVAVGTPTVTWIKATTSGNTVTLTVNPSGLSAGLYAGTVPVTSTTYSNTLNYPVVLMVNGGAAQSGPLTLSASSIPFTNVAAATSYTLNVTAATATSFTASTSLQSCAGYNWLGISPGGNLSASTTNTAITVTVYPSGIASGTTCNGTVSLATATNTQTVGVNMTVGVSTGNIGTLTLNGATSNVYDLSFTYTPAGQPQEPFVGIQDSAAGANYYSYQVSTSSGGNWLWANYNTSGTVYGPLSAGSRAAVTVSLSSVSASLPDGAYQGSVALTSPSGSTATINVTLYVDTTGAAPGVTVSPGVVYLFPSVPVNYTALQSQQFAVGANAGISMGTATPASTAPSWFSMSSPTPSGNMQFFTVNANPSGLAAGIYTTTITVTSTGTQSGTTTILIVLPVGQGLPPAQQFYPLTPCRLADTRTGAGFIGTQGPPYLTGGILRSFPVAGLCGVPANATAYSLNVTVVPRTGALGFLTTWPTGQPQPNASTLNSPEGQVVANAALVPAGNNGNINIYASNDTDVLFDINGYFAPPAPSGLQFYPLTPCRVADTRTGAGFSGSQGPPYLSGGTSRNFQVSGLCGVPATAAAYSLNVTVVPRTAALGFLTTWPTGQTRPWASTLNSPDGLVVANAALVPAGTNGDIGIYASDATDVLFDINGYFAAPGASGLDYYAMTPCRVADTRSWAGFPGQLGPPTMAGNTSRSFPVQSSACNVPFAAAAYSLNVTVVPSAGVLDYLTTWPAGQPQPWASTLNSPVGLVVANAALVPAGTAGALSIYVSDPTDVLFDIGGFFAAGP